MRKAQFEVGKCPVFMSNRAPYFSIVVPVYKGEASLHELYVRVKQSVSKLPGDFELLLIHDASPDNSWEIIRELCRQDCRVKGINLSRNFGQHYAITAGLSFAKGEWVIVMDCDLQDRPEEIPALFAKCGEGFDSVFAQRIHRHDTWVKRFQSKLFYAVFSYLTDTKMDASVANFGIYNRRVIEAILSMGDKLRYFPVMAQWVGFRQAFYPVQHDERKHGTSSYSFFAMLKLATDAIVGFSEKPLRLCIVAGFGVTLIAFVLSVLYFFGALLHRFTVSGFASIMISLWFIAGVIMIVLGLLGTYLGKIFHQVKNRPLFIVSETLNGE